MSRIRTSKKILSVLALAGLPVSVPAGGLEALTGSVYVIDPDSVMPGYCQRRDNGHTEGLFRSRSGGITMWRNFPPEDDESMLPLILKDQLAEKVTAMDFTLSRSELDWGVYILFGSLRVADDQKDVVMKLHPLADTNYTIEDIRYFATIVPAEHQKPDYEDIENYSGMQFCILLSTTKRNTPDVREADRMMYSTR